MVAGRPDNPKISACRPEMIAPLRNGTAIAELYSGRRPIPVPDGLIHDWIGALRIPGVTIKKTLAVVQEYLFTGLNRG
jgi:hypothetical protein